VLCAHRHDDSTSERGRRASWQLGRRGRRDGRHGGLLRQATVGDRTAQHSTAQRDGGPPVAPGGSRCCGAPPLGRRRWINASSITETNRIELVLSGMQNRTYGPYLTAFNRIFIIVMLVGMRANCIVCILLHHELRKAGHSFIPRFVAEEGSIRLVKQPTLMSDVTMLTVRIDFCCVMGERTVDLWRQRGSPALGAVMQRRGRPGSYSTVRDPINGCQIGTESSYSAFQIGSTASVPGAAGAPLGTIVALLGSLPTLPRFSTTWQRLGSCRLVMLVVRIIRLGLWLPNRVQIPCCSC
jgi:hypothetical protein